MMATFLRSFLSVTMDICLQLLLTFSLAKVAGAKALTTVSAAAQVRTKRNNIVSITMPNL
jgi:hypothetical protein